MRCCVGPRATATFLRRQYVAIYQFLGKQLVSRYIYLGLGFPGDVWSWSSLQSFALSVTLVAGPRCRRFCVSFVTRPPAPVWRVVASLLPRRRRPVACRTVRRRVLVSARGSFCAGSGLHEGPAVEPVASALPPCCVGGGHHVGPDVEPFLPLPLRVMWGPCVGTATWCVVQLGRRVRGRFSRGPFCGGSGLAEARLLGLLPLLSFRLAWGVVTTVVRLSSRAPPLPPPASSTIDMCILLFPFFFVDPPFFFIYIYIYIYIYILFIFFASI